MSVIQLFLCSLNSKYWDTEKKTILPSQELRLYEDNYQIYAFIYIIGCDGVKYKVLLEQFRT